MRLSLYLVRDTPVHALHPVAKVWALLALLVAAFVTSSAGRGLLLWLIVAGLLAWGRAGANVYRLRWLFVLVFAMTWLVWSLFLRTEGAWVEIGPLHPSWQSVQMGLGMAMRITSFFALGLLFLSTTRIEEFAYALRRCGVPPKVAFVFTLAFRLVPLFVEAALTVLDAQRCRGLDLSQGPWHQRARRYAMVIVPIFIGALRRADGMAIALEARGFQRAGTRTSYLRFRWTHRDSVASVCATLLAVAWLAL